MKYNNEELTGLFPLWLGAMNAVITIHVPKDCAKAYQSFASNPENNCDWYDPILINFVSDNTPKPNTALTVGLAVGLGLGIPALAGGIAGTVYGVRKHKRKVAAIEENDEE